MFLPFLFLLVFLPSLISSHNRDSHIFNLIHRNRDYEANSTRFSLFSLENSEGFFSFESLATHAFPCLTSLQEWPDSSATLLLPCQHNSIVDREALVDFMKNYPRVAIPSKCSVIKGLEMDFTAVEIGLNTSLRLDGDKSLRIFSNSYSRHTKHLDRPIIQFSYIRNDGDCDISCENSNYSIYSTPSCIGQMISEDETDACDMLNGTCLWSSFPKGKSTFAKNKYLHKQKYIRMMGRDETATLLSPYIAHTSIKCSFIIDAFMEEGSSMDLSYSTRDGNNSGTVHLPQSHTPFKFKPLSISIGHFFSPVRMNITCHKGSICNIDNLRFKNCEDDSSVVDICPPSSSFLCSSSSQSKCLSNDRICDLVNDCDYGEDEEDCDDIPSYALCDFSTSSIWPFCTNWTSRGELKGISYGEANGRDGNSMKFEMRSEDFIAGRRISFTSPKLPPTSRKVMDPHSPLHGSCTLRFSFCAPNRMTWLDIIWKISGEKTIWNLQESKKITWGTSKCEWRREAIQIPSMINEYSLIFDIEPTRRESSNSSFEIADVSIAESCFINDSSTISSIPSVYNLWPCNGTGHLPPSIEECQRFYNETDEREQLLIERSGWMTWIAPNTNQYRVELCGASGGSLDGQLGGRGGCIVTILSLSYREKLEVMIGQEGEKNCSECESSPGGGATVIKKKDGKDSSIARTILVAGGGGGISKRTRNRENEGGILSLSISTEELGYMFTNWKTGDGFSHAFFPYFNSHCEQSECESMDINSNRGGRCPNQNDSMRRGGYGGGAPSCGESPGPGGGYIGGNRNHTKTGGTSYVFNQEILFNVFSGIHTGQGFVRIFPCSLSCSFNQSCVFQSANRGEESEMRCECIEGTDCIQIIINDASNFYLLMAAFFSALAFALLLYGINQRRNRSRDRIAFNRQIQDIEMINLDMIDIESFDCLDNLNRIKIPHIPREKIIFGRMLGKGAFGEVFHAQIQEDGNQAEEVAVKTLSLTLDLETQIDFTFETLTLHKLNHPNIVRAIGINTEGDPYCLILEYMTGGDLLSFLRDYRKKELKVDITMNMGDILSMAIDVASGCEYLESNHYVHRDIAARNCLLTRREEGRRVKLGDFGMARDVYSVDYYRKHGRAKMPVKWLPPESYLEGIFTNKADVWSYGVLLWEIFSLGHMPYPGLSNFEVMETVRLGKRLLPPDGTSNAIYSLMQSTWKIDPNSRPSFKQILSIFQTMANDELETIKRVPPGSVPYGLLQTEDNGDIEKNYPSITYSHKKKDEIKEDLEDKSLLD